MTVATPFPLERGNRLSTPTTNSGPQTGGAYGLRVEGVAALPNELIDAPAHWPAVELRVRVTSAPAQPAEYIDPDRACLQVRSGGYVTMNRAAQRASFTFATRPTPSALLHPHLAVVGAVWSHWTDRQAFHAGGFVACGGVWGLLGEKGAGKSSTLAALASAGVPIVCDDVLVLDGMAALAGPRSIDLRDDAANRFGLGEPLGVVGDRERWRVPLAAIAPELPFCGWVTLRWSDEPALRPVRGAERARQLLEHLALRVPPRTAGAVFELAGLPFLELSRPRRWGSIGETVELLLDALPR